MITMSMARNGLQLTGPGAAYLRVSGDRQEVDRQMASRAAFEKRHGVKIAAQHQYEDDMPRDLSDKRPDFQKMLRAAKAGQIKWIYIDQIDRLGYADNWELVEIVSIFRKAGCKLYDAGDKEWTGRELMSFFEVGLAGHQSHEEQKTRSHRSLGGMIVKARAGEWQGGPPKLGFDIGCFDKVTGAELWRVVFEGRDQDGMTKRRGKMRPVYHVRRQKVYPDGRTERFGGNVVFRTNKDSQVMRIVPSRDPARLAAARGVFTRYATESITFFALARWLNRQGIRNSFGNCFQSRDISELLRDESYLGYPTFSKRRNGRFHRVAAGNVFELEPGLKGKDTENKREDIIKSSARFFEPLVDRPTWDAVQKKLGARKARGHAPRNPDLYLAGLVHCAGCGLPMVARTDRMEYSCGSWDRHRARGTLADSPCLRNGVKQVVIEEYIGRYLEETGRRLEILVGPDLNTDHLTSNQDGQERGAWDGFVQGMGRLTDYLARHHPEEYDAILAEAEARHAEADRQGRAGGDTPPPPGGYLAGTLGRINLAEINRADQDARPRSCGDFADACIQRYRALFDPQAVLAELAKKKAEHDRLVIGWADLPTKRAKDTARTRLEKLEGEMEELERQREDAAALVEGYYRQMLDLRQAVEAARHAMHKERTDQALRQRAEALRSILCDGGIEAEFVLTGKRSRGPGQAGSRLVALTFRPTVGDTRRLEVTPEEGAGAGEGEGAGAGGNGGYRSQGSP
jgi:DNA invertase Pin-like site-specific DNA recombinase